MTFLTVLAFYAVIVWVLMGRAEEERVARIAAEIQLAQVTAHRDRLAEMLARYEAPLDQKRIAWVVAAHGLPLLTLN